MTSSTTTHSNIIIFGATGPSGRQLVEQALTAGHRVTAYVRDASRLDVEHPNLRVAVGDVLDPATVTAAITGHDAVLVALGTAPRSKAELRTRGTQIIVDAMRATGVDRIVCLSVLGIGDSEPLMDWTLRYLLVPLLLKRAFVDHEGQEAVLRTSGLNWTAVRPPHLTNGPALGDFAHGFSADAPNLTLKISRADLAAYMLAVVDDPTSFGTTPGISYLKKRRRSTRSARCQAQAGAR